MTEGAFDPDWVVVPGDTLREWMDEKGLSERPMATACGRMDVAVLRGVLGGEEPITEHVARQLEAGTMIPARLWVNLERAYRDGLRAGKLADLGRGE